LAAMLEERCCGRGEYPLGGCAEASLRAVAARSNTMSSSPVIDPSSIAHVEGTTTRAAMTTVGTNGTATAIELGAASEQAGEVQRRWSRSVTSGALAQLTIVPVQTLLHPCCCGLGSARVCLYGTAQRSPDFGSWLGDHALACTGTAEMIPDRAQELAEKPRWTQMDVRHMATGSVRGPVLG